MSSDFRNRPSRLRREWNRIIETEGAKLGLSGCRSFLENKIVNDIFYEGKFNGRPCIVKCSSRAPDSIANEYKMLRRVHAAEPSVFPEPFALWTAPDGRMAFVAMTGASASAISVSFSVSDSYAQHLAVVLTSILYHNPESSFVFHVLHRDITDENIAKVRELENFRPCGACGPSRTGDDIIPGNWDFDINRVSVGKGTYGPLDVLIHGESDAELCIGNYCSIAQFDEAKVTPESVERLYADITNENFEAIVSEFFSKEGVGAT